MKEITFVLIASASLFLNTAYAGKIVKWVDNNGVTQYGDTLPPEYADRKNSEINERGLVIKQNNVQKVPSSEAKTQLDAEQLRKDKILLASYSIANEIDLARDRSLEMDKAALTSLTAQKENITARVARNNQTVDSFKKRNKPLPVKLENEFKDAVAQSARIDKQMADRKLAMEVTKKNYAADKERFIALKQAAGRIVTPTSEIAPPAANEMTKQGTQK